MKLFADEFAPGSLRDFDGRTWGGIRLEDITRDEVKRLYKTKGGKFVRAEATILSLPSASPWEVQLLQDGTRGSARITGFYVAFRDGGTRLEQLELDAKDGEEWYAQDRYSDWNLLAYPDKGIALMVLKDRDNKIPVAVLTTTGRLKRILDKMDQRSTRIEDPRDAFDRLRTDIEIGDVSVSLSKKDIKPHNENRFKENLQDRTERDIDRGDVHYRSSAKGTVSISVSITFREDKDNNKVEITAQLDGENERGKISASGSGSARLSSNQAKAEDDLQYMTERALRDALDSLRSDVDNRLRGQKPPSIDDLRTRGFLDLLDGPTK